MGGFRLRLDGLFGRGGFRLRLDGLFGRGVELQAVRSRVGTQLFRDRLGDKYLPVHELDRNGGNQELPGRAGDSNLGHLDQPFGVVVNTACLRWLP